MKPIVPFRTSHTYTHRDKHANDYKGAPLADRGDGWLGAIDQRRHAILRILLFQYPSTKIHVCNENYARRVFPFNFVGVEPLSLSLSYRKSLFPFPIPLRLECVYAKQSALAERERERAPATPN